MSYAGILIPFVGGLGMFIYGMQIMAAGLEHAAGNKMKTVLEALTKNKFMGVLLGAAITAVIQSSSATTAIKQQITKSKKLLWRSTLEGHSCKSSFLIIP